MKVLAAAAFSLIHQGAAVTLNPITRVVQLLNGLAEQAEKEGKKEEDLYETYVCWAKTVIDSKTATNAAAEAKIEELNQYISDLDAGRIELTSERQDLETQIKDLTQDLEAMEDQRNKENQDYLDSKAEMEKAETALGEAIKVLGEATENNTEGTFLQTRASSTETFQERIGQAAALQYAVELGAKFLDKGDALFLHRILNAEVPKADWKKLNRKANFKMAYKGRSFKIQDILKKMRQTFQTNLADAQAKEEASLGEYNKLSAAKNAELTTAQTALTKMAGENGAKGQSKEDAQAEVDALTTQVTNDKKFIEQTKKGLADKKAEWKARKELRAGEIEAISKAVEILHSDDARDQFKKSFASNSFLQLSTSSKKLKQVSNIFYKTAHASGDARVYGLLQTLTEPAATGTHFDEVIGAIDTMIAKLKGEEQTDLDQVNLCDADRATDTRAAIVAARTVDDSTATIREAEADIEQIDQTIKENNEEIENLNNTIIEATKTRADEFAAWEAADADDKAAGELVMSAHGVLQKFYADNNLMSLVQMRKMDPGAAGDAPPPPPPTWEAPYGGKTGEATGIIAILEMIKEDIDKDRAKAKEEETEDEANFQTFKTNSEKEIEGLQTANNDLDDTKSEKQTTISETKQTRTTEKGNLQASIQKINDATEGCDYFTINYEVRRKNRHIEIDGLIKAKAILQGGEFPSALLQRHN